MPRVHNRLKTPDNLLLQPPLFHGIHSSCIYHREFHLVPQRQHALPHLLTFCSFRTKDSSLSFSLANSYSSWGWSLIVILCGKLSCPFLKMWFSTPKCVLKTLSTIIKHSLYFIAITHLVFVHSARPQALWQWGPSRSCQSLALMIPSGMGKVLKLYFFI